MRRQQQANKTALHLERLRTLNFFGHDHVALAGGILKSLSVQDMDFSLWKYSTGHYMVLTGAHGPDRSQDVQRSRRPGGRTVRVGDFAGQGRSLDGR